jgi:hypothetical protein
MSFFDSRLRTVTISPAAPLCMASAFKVTVSGPSMAATSIEVPLAHQRAAGDVAPGEDPAGRNAAGKSEIAVGGVGRQHVVLAQEIDPADIERRGIERIAAIRRLACDPGIAHELKAEQDGGFAQRGTGRFQADAEQQGGGGWAGNSAITSAMGAAAGAGSTHGTGQFQLQIAHQIEMLDELLREGGERLLAGQGIGGRRQAGGGGRGRARAGSEESPWAWPREARARRKAPRRR